MTMTHDLDDPGRHDHRWHRETEPDLKAILPFPNGHMIMRGRPGPRPQASRKSTPADRLSRPALSISIRIMTARRPGPAPSAHPRCMGCTSIDHGQLRRGVRALPALKTMTASFGSWKVSRTSPSPFSRKACPGTGRTSRTIWTACLTSGSSMLTFARNCPTPRLRVYRDGRTRCQSRRPCQRRTISQRMKRALATEAIMRGRASAFPRPAH